MTNDPQPLPDVKGRTVNRPVGRGPCPSRGYRGQGPCDRCRHGASPDSWHRSKSVSRDAQRNCAGWSTRD